MAWGFKSPSSHHPFPSTWTFQSPVPVGIYDRSRKSEIEFFWIQVEDVIEHGKNKDAKTRLELLNRIYRFLANTLPKNNQEKKGGGYKG
jgi:hypothetical protein